MTADPETLACYARMAEDYQARLSPDTADADLLAFLDALPGGSAPVLDWGAGPGASAALMIARGVAAEATDASPEMVALAQKRGVPARQEVFEALVPGPRYRGVWANFSLLHADPEALPGLILRAAGTLLPGGVLHLGMKTGSGASRDTLGRRYAYVTEAALDAMTGAAGLTGISTRHGAGKGLAGTVDPYVIHLSRMPADG